LARQCDSVFFLFVGDQPSVVSPIVFQRQQFLHGSTSVDCPDNRHFLASDVDESRDKSDPLQRCLRFIDRFTIEAMNLNTEMANSIPAA